MLGAAAQILRGTGHGAAVTPPPAPAAPMQARTQIDLAAPQALHEDLSEKRLLPAEHQKRAFERV